MEWKDYASGIFGLAGVLVGGGLGMFKDVYMQRRNDRKHLQYLAIQVTFALDEYVNGAASVVLDDGRADGQRDERGYLQATTTYPQLRPEQIDVEWTTLPTDLLHEIFDLPRRTTDAIGAIGQVAEFGWGPPDFEDFFEERQIQFSELGLHAAATAVRLRELAKLPPRRINPTWDPVNELTTHGARAATRRKARLE